MSVNRRTIALLLLSLTVILQTAVVCADGIVVKPRNYSGSLEERSQEAIIVFHVDAKNPDATEDLILKIQVQGQASSFAWVVPFPNRPEVSKDDPKLFHELFNYVEARLRPRQSSGTKDAVGAASDQATPKANVEVLERKVVGSFDVAIVRETESGGLNPWLSDNGYQELSGADDLLEFYRKKNYVFACIRVSDTGLETNGTIDSHPLRFRFRTGGRDGIYFPMRMTGLQNDRFDVNLYVFYRFWINRDLNPFGFENRGFRLRHRDWDTGRCVANGGKHWADPQADPYLRTESLRIPKVSEWFRQHYPKARFYLTNIQALGVEPDAIRQWQDDLWLFPHYTNRRMVPYDARPGGPASAAWPDLKVKDATSIPTVPPVKKIWWTAAIGVLVILMGVTAWIAWRLLRRQELTAT